MEAKKKYDIMIVDFQTRTVHEYPIEADSFLQATQQVRQMIHPQIALHWEENEEGALVATDAEGLVKVWVKEVSDGE